MQILSDPHYFMNIPKRNNVNQEIVCLRGLACLFIFLQHLFGWFFVSQGSVLGIGYITSFLGKLLQPLGDTNPGVIFFITLSGYCIHRNGLRDLDGKSIKNFYLKRVVRIYPLFLVGNFAGILFWAISRNREYTNICSATDVILIKNIIYKIMGIGVFTPYNYKESYCGNAPLITISIILTLYLLYPVFLRIQSYQIVLFVSVLYIINLAYTLNINRPDMYTWYYNASIISFMPIWWIGVYFTGKVKCRREILSGSLVYLSIVFITALFYECVDDTALFFMSEVKRIALAVAFSALIRQSDKMDMEEKRGKSRSAILLLCGRISFSVYCIHAPVIIFLLSMKMDLLTIIVICVMSALGIYIFIEQKLSKKLKEIIL